MRLDLDEKQIIELEDFMSTYVSAKNAADGSAIDANANVTTKNIATMEYEMFKCYTAQLNKHILKTKINELFGGGLGEEFIRQINDHEIYLHDASSIKNYCASITMYPFLLHGMTHLGGDSEAPKHLSSFAGSFINLLGAVSAHLCGAVGTVEFLMYFDYFAKKDYGDNYLETNKNDINQYLQQVIYSLNQPTAARGYQSPFWNISLFDREYFNAVFGEFVFPDDEFTQPNYDSLAKLQKYFMDWFNEERKRKLLTFPVVTASALTENGKVKDRQFAEFMADQQAKGNSFFVYLSDNADSLSSCCRLRNELTENLFSNSFGCGGVATGSLNVITLNFNRMVQKGADLKEQMDKLHKYQYAYRKIAEERIAQHLYPIYDEGFINIDKQFLTIGINGMVEAAEYLGYDISYNPDYVGWLASQLKIIFDSNKEARKTYGCMFNTEFVPAENLGVKNAKWDREDGLMVNRDCYNSYFYRVEDPDVDPVDKILLHGREVVQYLDGGSALHLNLEEYLTKDGFIKLYDACAKAGCNYFTTNVKVTICNKCGYINKNTMDHCTACGSTDVDYGTRIIGYLKRITAFSSPRQREESRRVYHKQLGTGKPMFGE